MNLNTSFNQTVYISSMKLSNEPFLVFLIMNIIQLLFSSIGIFTSLFFILTVILNPAARTLSNILTCNSSLAVLILASDTLAIAIYILYRDLSPTKMIMHNMFLCHLRANISQISFCALVHSFVIQGFHRLVSIVYYNRCYHRSFCPYLCAILIQWIIAIVYMLPIVIANDQVYVEEEYLCQVAIDKTRVILYVCTIVYFIPLPLILVQYCIIAVFSRRAKHRTHNFNIQRRARRQMKLIGRICILIGILLVLGTPYCTFIVLDALSLVPAPRYTHRVGFLSIGIATGCSMLMMIYFNRNIKRLIFKRKRGEKRNKRILQQSQRHAVEKCGKLLQSETTVVDNNATL